MSQTHLVFLGLSCAPSTQASVCRVRPYQGVLIDILRWLQAPHSLYFHLYAIRRTGYGFIFKLEEGRHRAPSNNRTMYVVSLNGRYLFFDRTSHMMHELPISCKVVRSIMYVIHQRQTLMVWQPRQPVVCAVTPGLGLFFTRHFAACMASFFIH